MTNKTNQEFNMVNDVRCSFPHLWVRPTINGKEAAYGCVFLLEKGRHDKQIQALEKRIESILQDKNDGQSLKAEKLCLRDGDGEGERAEYAGHMYLSANTEARPRIIGPRASELVTSVEDDKIYAGCHVNAKVALWFQNNTHGKRVNAQLVAVQFNRDGEAFTSAYVAEEDAMSGFGDVENDDMFD